jgi:hypothetical protein
LHSDRAVHAVYVWSESEGADASTTLSRLYGYGAMRMRRRRCGFCGMI